VTRHVDHPELSELAYRYAACVDERDAEGAAALFTEDGVLIVPEPPATTRPVREHRGREAIARSFAPLEGLRLTFRAVTGVVVEDGVLAGTARGRVTCIAHHVDDRTDGVRDHVWFIRYLDEYRRTAEGWRISRRELHLDLLDSRSLADSAALRSDLPPTPQ